MNHPDLPKDGVPMWDFGSKPDSDEPRDASAGAIMASAFLELSTLVKNGKPYHDLATRELLTLSSSVFLAEPGTHGGFILTRSTGHLSVNSEINVPLNYADHYFLEALLRYRSLKEGTNRVPLGAAN